MEFTRLQLPAVALTMTYITYIMYTKTIGHVNRIIRRVTYKIQPITKELR